MLRDGSYHGLCNESWMTEVADELSTRCPIVAEILSRLLDCSLHMRQVSGLGIWRRVECRALQRYGGNNIKVQSAPLSVFPVFNLGGRCSDVWLCYITSYPCKETLYDERVK